jgi:hypothetical protein
MDQPATSPDLGSKILVVGLTIFIIVSFVLLAIGAIIWNLCGSRSSRPSGAISNGQNSQQAQFHELERIGS